MKIKSKKIIAFALSLGIMLPSCVYADTISKNQNAQVDMNNYLQGRKSPKEENLLVKIDLIQR